jgi:glycosyltransferase involved in cell wall biosynthesis
MPRRHASMTDAELTPGPAADDGETAASHPVRGHPKAPLVSCLCVTDDREPFLPWLSWNFGRQTWPYRELVIVTSTDVPRSIAGAPGVRVVEVAHGTNVPAKRNVALDAAEGSIVAWFDDDDWQHPRRLEHLVAAISDETPIAGWASAWFVDLAQSRCAPYRRRERVLFNGAGFRTEVARSVRFDPAVSRASDSGWLRGLTSRRQRTAKVLPGDNGFFWLCHDQNISNPARSRRFPDGLETLRGRLIGAWRDTDEQLDALRQRLQRRASASALPTVVAAGSREPAPSAPGPADAPSAGRPGSPPVAAVVKACALDVPFLEITLPHMLRQARFRFVERLLVLDRRRTFAGKYQSRGRGGEGELDRVVADLLAAGHVDRVVEVDSETDHARGVMARYFGKRGAPAYAATGGPIYATLLGLEEAPVDHVVQFDSDMLFHAAGPSWVEAGLAKLQADDSVWVVMTHAGPPAGPLGATSSLGSLNSRRSRWDARLGAWRCHTVSTRYFLTDRRRLHGKLAPVPMAGGCAPLEICIGRAMQRHRASRANLALEGSWDLHPYSHEAPFPEWAEAIAAAVERGDVPRGQRGKYDLRLDLPQERQAWADLLGIAGQARPSKPMSVEVSSRASAPSAPTTLPTPRAAREPDTAASEPRRGLAAASRDVAVAPIAVVIPVRDRAGARLQRCMASLAWQSGGPPLQTIVVSHGSRPETDAELEALCRDEGATLIRIGQPSDPWCKPLALNVGLRATDPALAFVMTLDADMILAPDFLANVLDMLREQPRRMVLCRSSDLPRGVEPPRRDALFDAFATLRASARLRGFQGSGGIQAASRAFFFEARGYDEDMVWWGAEDNDMVQRAALAGLEHAWICDRTAMLHQWHPTSVATTTDRRRRAEMLRARRNNHEIARSRAQQLVRNTDDWGRARPVAAASVLPPAGPLVRAPRRAAARVARRGVTEIPPPDPGWDAEHEQRLRHELDRVARTEPLGEGRMIAVVVPVFSRPDRVRPLLESFLAATRDEDAALYFVAQGSDTREVAAIRACGLEPLFVGDADQSWAKKINHGYARTVEPWLLLGADDLAFWPGWVDVIRADLSAHVGVIGTNDLGNAATMDGRHSTHPLVRRMYANVCGTVDERGKVVHEGYVHNFPDTELVATAKRRGLYLHRADCVIEHLHPAWGKARRDHVYAIGQRSARRDRAVFDERARKFGWATAANPSELGTRDPAVATAVVPHTVHSSDPKGEDRSASDRGSNEILLSILVPTMPGRERKLAFLLENLDAQVRRPDVELLVLRDNRSLTIGAKRNKLVQIARGEYVAFVDDDDAVAPDYVDALCIALLCDRPDLLCFTAVVRGHGPEKPCRFDPSFRDENLPHEYRRRPNHLMVWRRTLTASVPWPDVSHREDALWAEAVARVPARAVTLDRALYTYQFDPADNSSRPSRQSRRHVVKNRN